MKIGLNFYLFHTLMILSFVSFLGVSTAQAKPSGQGSTSANANSTDEFDLFEEEIKGAAKKPAPAAGSVSKAKAPPAGNKNEAQALFDKGDYAQVTTMLWKQIETLDRASLILLTKAHEKKNEPAEMIRALNILIGKNEKDAEAHYLSGNAFMLQKKSKDALEAYKAALELNPKYEAAYLAVADLYEKRNPPNLYEVRMIYQDMIEKIGPRVAYKTKLCEVNTKDGTYEAAITDCKSAILKDGSIANNYVYLGLAQKEIGDIEQAHATLKKAADKFPKSELAQYNYGHVLEEKKNYPEATKYFKTGTDADPKAARSWLGLANSSFEIRRFDVALEAFKKACKYENKNAAAFRKATGILRNARNSEWTSRFESAAEICTF